MPYFVSADKKSITCSFRSTYLHVDLFPPTLQKRCNLKIGCKFGRRMQACNFCSPQSQEKCKYSRQRSCFDILTFMRSLAPSNHAYMLPLGRGCSDTSWVRISGRKCAIPGMQGLGSGTAKLSSGSAEGGGTYLTAVCEAAYCFSPPPVCPRKRSKDVEKGGSNEHARSRIPPGLSVHFSADDGANPVLCI